MFGLRLDFLADQVAPAFAGPGGMTRTCRGQFLSFQHLPMRSRFVDDTSFVMDLE